MAKKETIKKDTSKADIKKDYANGVVNFRVLAKKYKKTVVEINNIVKSK